jgi:hypothetical protein
MVASGDRAARWVQRRNGTLCQPSATLTLRAAAHATAEARGFTFSLPSVEVTYNAPDTVEQVEHGQSVSSGSVGSGSTTGGAASGVAPQLEVLTEIFIGDRYFEADNHPGQTHSFSFLHGRLATPTRRLVTC